MSEISDLVSVTVTEESAAVSQQGFGTPLIMSCEAATVFGQQVTRIYTDPTSPVTDGFSATGMTVAAINAIFAQQPNPGQVVIGARAHLPTRVVTLTPVVKSNYQYAITIDGSTYTFTSPGSATAAEIVTGLSTAITADSGATVTPSGTSTLTLTSKVAGHIFQLVVASIDMTQVDSSTDAGIATDLTTIQTSPTGNDDWYMALSDDKSKAAIAALATAISALDRMYIFSSADDACYDSASTTDAIAVAHTANQRRVAGVYHPKNGQNCDVAWAGSRLPYVPGSETWMYAQLFNVDTVPLTATQRANLVAKKGNYYRSAAGRSFMHGGTTADGDFIDNVRGVDWTTARIAEAVFGLLVSKTKVPMTDKGITAVQTQVQSVLNTGVSNGLFTDNPAPVVTVPKASAISDADRAARRLNGVTFTAMFANAIHYVGVTGTISV